MPKSFKIFLLVLLVIVVAAFLMWRQGILSSVKLPLILKTPNPGTCLLVEEKYCASAEFIYVEGSRDPILGFTLPAGTPIFTPIDGVMTTIFLNNPKNSENPYRGALVRHFTTPNSTIGLISVNVIANPLTDINQNQEIQQGDILGYVSGEPVDIFGSRNLIVSIENQAQTPGTVYSNTNLYIEDKLGI
jgi:hypothetical protein